MNLMRGIDLKKIAEKMNGASGAELKVWFITLYMSSLFSLIVLSGCKGEDLYLFWSDLKLLLFEMY